MPASSVGDPVVTSLFRSTRLSATLNVVVLIVVVVPDTVKLPVIVQLSLM